MTTLEIGNLMGEIARDMFVVAVQKEREGKRAESIQAYDYAAKHLSNHLPNATLEDRTGTLLILVEFAYFMLVFEFLRC